MPMCVRPWKPPLNETIPGRPVYARATFTAFSTASAPVETSIVLAGLATGASAFNRSARRT